MTCPFETMKTYTPAEVDALIKFAIEESSKQTADALGHGLAMAAGREAIRQVAEERQDAFTAVESWRSLAEEMETLLVAEGVIQPDERVVQPRVFH